jgi:hypothetical protein
VAEDHDVYACGEDVRAQIGQVVEDVDGQTRELEVPRLWQNGCPVRLVDVASDRRGGRERLKCLQDRGATYVTSMDDVLGAPKLVHRFGTQEAVRV